MSLAAEILVRPSRRLAAAVLGMALAGNLALGVWLHAVWHAGAEQFSVAWASGLVAGAWIASCVLTGRWWRARGTQRLVIEGNGEAVWLDRPEVRRRNGQHSGCHSAGASMGRTDAESHATAVTDMTTPPGARRLRPVPGSLAWPGIISLQFVADTARQHHEGRSGSAPLIAVVVLADSVSPTDHRALALWMHWLQRKGVPQVRALRTA